MNTYYETLIRAVETAGLYHPIIVLDDVRLTANLKRLRAALPKGIALRLADKSLPVPELLARGFQAFDTDRVMSFHLPLTAKVLNQFPKVQALMGKPMPVAAAAQFLATSPDAARVTWLIDSEARLKDYRILSQETGQTLHIAFEVNIGLGRGGFETPQDLKNALGNAAPLKVVGVMGYEAHVNALPGFLGGGRKAQIAAMNHLEAFTQCLADHQREIINTGGSSTVLGIPENGPANDFTLGSLMVKPSDFDQPLNAAIEPAFHIVTPVLKTYPHGLPGRPRLSKWLRNTHIIRDQIAFCYGGKWMAKPVFPSGLSASPFFNASSNQHGLCLPRGANDPSHIVFRPTQSEAILQQFPTLHVFDGTSISDGYAPFSIC